MCALRGDDIGMVFQEPMTALNPLKTIGEQVAEGIRWHTGANRADAEALARKMLDRVGLPAEKFPLSRYPHELSGGQRQRVVIAIACALKPKLLIADEPTTALDVVLQAQILELLRDLVDENRMGLLLISHDLAVVTEMADRITILRHGEVMEAGETAQTLSAQAHPYTRQLAQASMHVPGARGKRSHSTLDLRRDCAPASPSRTSPSDYPGTPHLALPQAAADPRRRRRLLLARRRPLGGAGRALGLRQVHARPHDPGARRADVRHDRLPGRNDHRARPGIAAVRPARHAGRVPGPLRLVQSAPDGRVAGRRTAAPARRKARATPSGANWYRRHCTRSG